MEEMPDFIVGESVINYTADARKLVSQAAASCKFYICRRTPMIRLDTRCKEILGARVLILWVSGVWVVDYDGIPLGMIYPL